MRTWIMMAATMGLISCGGERRDKTAPVATQSQPETGAALQVARLDETQRNGVFERAIRASGAPCPTVTGSQRAQVRPGIRGWKAQCNDDTAHLLEITSDGTAKVTSRIR